MEIDKFMDELLNFSVSEEEVEDYEGEKEDMRPPRNIIRRKTGLRQADCFGLCNLDDPGVLEEEDLEWISNKDAFPVIETFVDILPSEHIRVASSERETTEVKHLSPISVLETSCNSSTTTTTTTSNSSGGSNGNAPVVANTTVMSCCVGLNVPFTEKIKRLRTGRRTRRRNLGVLWTGNNKQGPQKKKTLTVAAAIGRKCQHCGAEKTPQWRAGPMGAKTLCNACGVRYKSGRLVPEYRPANSPTYSAELHSNSHRKIIEMRKQFQYGDDDREDCG